MAFSNDVLRAALEKVIERRKKAEREYDKRKELVFTSDPALAELQTQLRIKSSKLALYAISGNSEQLSALKNELDVLNSNYLMALTVNSLDKGPKFVCAICNDTGYSDGVLCKCVKDIASQMSYSSLNGELPLKTSTFQNFDLSYYSEEKNEIGISPKKQMVANLKVCKDFANTFPNGGNLLLTGASGLGKTHLSLAVANVILERGYHVIYGSAQNLINEVGRETFDRSGSTEKQDSLNSCDLLILDDLGTEFSTQLSVSVVYNIINTRLLKGLSTIISTNLDIKELSDTYNERITSRIIGNYSICPFFGKDIRKKKLFEK